jgi:hypothetical protein
MRRQTATRRDRKPSRQMRIRGVYLQPLDALAKRNGTTPPQEANRAIRELLEREQLWPPAPG